MQILNKLQLELFSSGGHQLVNTFLFWLIHVNYLLMGNFNVKATYSSEAEQTNLRIPYSTLVDSFFWMESSWWLSEEHSTVRMVCFGRVLY